MRTALLIKFISNRQSFYFTQTLDIVVACMLTKTRFMLADCDKIVTKKTNNAIK